MPSRPVRVLIADDEHSYREALAFRLRYEPDMDVREAKKPRAAGKLARIDVALIGFAGDSPERALTALARFVERNRRGAGVLLTPRDVAIEFAMSLDLGGAGAISRRATLDEILDCVRRLGRREPLDPPDGMVENLLAVQRVRSAMHAIDLRAIRLTKRERTVLEWMALGYSGPEIARRLSIAEKTERNHVANILTKLGVNTQLQAVLCAVSIGLVEPPTPLDYWEPRHMSDVVDVRHAPSAPTSIPFS